MKRSSDEGARARYEDALRHQGRAGAARASSRHAGTASQPSQSDSAVDSARDFAGSRAARRNAERSVERSFGRDSKEEAELGPQRRGARAQRFEREGEPVDVESACRLQAARRRRARQKVRATTLLFLVPTAAASLALIAMSSVVLRDLRLYESEERIARAQLAALEEQLANGERRLATLKSNKGREQLLVEHGFIRPGDRVLLFPAAPEEESAATARNDIAARRGAFREAVSSSAWERASRTVSEWVGSLRSKAAPVLRLLQIRPQVLPRRPVRLRVSQCPQRQRAKSLRNLEARCWKLCGVANEKHPRRAGCWNGCVGLCGCAVASDD
jgi:hypothetical protein